MVSVVVLLFVVSAFGLAQAPAGNPAPATPPPAAVKPPSVPATPAAAPAAQAVSLRQQMEIALQKQRQSVKRQVQSAQQDDGGWFTTGWSSDVPLAQPMAPTQQAPPQTDGTTNPPPVPAKTAAFCAPIKPIELDNAIRTAASREGYSADLLKAVIKQESAFDPCAISSKGAMGLMQLMPTTASQLGVADPFNPNENLNGGAKYLGQLLSKYNGDVKLALGAYNAGPTRVDQFGDVPPIPETQNYVRAILSALNIGQ